LARLTATVNTTKSTATNEQATNELATNEQEFEICARIYCYLAGLEGARRPQDKNAFLGCRTPSIPFWRYDRHRGWTPESPRGVWLATEDYRSVQALLLARAEGVSFRDQSSSRARLKP